MENPMRRFAFASGCCAILLVGCGQSGGKSTAADTTAATTPPPAPAPAALTFGDVAGKWNLKVMPQTGDSTLITEVMTATAADTGWTIVRGKLKAEKVRPTVSGDSLITEGGPYPSALHKGLKVTTHTVWRLQGGNLVGATEARYNTKGADSLHHYRVEGTRAQ
jgi:hypothetical protein